MKKNSGKVKHGYNFRIFNIKLVETINAKLNYD